MEPRRFSAEPEEPQRFSAGPEELQRFSAQISAEPPLMI